MSDTLEQPSELDEHRSKMNVPPLFTGYIEIPTLQEERRIRDPIRKAEILFFLIRSLASGSLNQISSLYSCIQNTVHGKFQNPRVAVAPSIID